MAAPIIPRHLATDEAEIRSAGANDMVAAIFQAYSHFAARADLVVPPKHLALERLWLQLFTLFGERYTLAMVPEGKTLVNHRREIVRIQLLRALAGRPVGIVL